MYLVHYYYFYIYIYKCIYILYTVGTAMAALVAFNFDMFAFFFGKLSYMLLYVHVSTDMSSTSFATCTLVLRWATIINDHGL